MHFEWDSEKSNSNKTKHRIDFETAQNIWLDNDRIEIKAPHPIEDRWIVIGTIEDKVWAAIYTFRGEGYQNYLGKTCPGKGGETL
jgi:hypothetical protein